jgi:ring-1,2-phenylacetyl-CoA epoxidase subunit PaaE
MSEKINVLIGANIEGLKTALAESGKSLSDFGTIAEQAPKRAKTAVDELNKSYRDAVRDAKNLYLMQGQTSEAFYEAELKAKNVSESAIKFELFSSTSAEKSESTSQGNTTISILVDGETTTFEMPQKQTVLEAALKKGIDAPYSCQGGICSSCLGRVTKGSAHMVKNTILSDSEVAEGLILTCQAHPTSSELFVDFDDV